jgi:outer membrane lipoprotein SlyB
MASLALPLAAQTYDQHQEAEHAQTRSDHRHHTGAKIVGGSAVGGAVVGGVLGGPKGAVLGAGVGAAGGAVANHARKQHDVKKRERTYPR